MEAQSITEAAAQRLDPAKVGPAAFKASLQILGKWGCNNAQKCQILGMGPSAFFEAKNHPDSVQLSSDQLTRISYLLTIHEALRAIFENPKNVCSFVAMINHNAPFNGVSPLEAIGNGDLLALHDTAAHITTLQSNSW